MSIEKLMNAVNDALDTNATAFIESFNPGNKEDYLPSGTLSLARTWLAGISGNVTFVRGFEEALRCQNEDGFRNLLHVLLAILVANDIETHLKSPLTSMGFHYTSEALGSWFRIKVKMKRSLYSVDPAAERLYENTYDLQPREENLILAEHAPKNSLFAFASDEARSSLTRKAPGALQVKMIFGSDLVEDLHELLRTGQWYDLLLGRSIELSETHIEDAVEELFETEFPQLYRKTEAGQKVKIIQSLLSTFFYHLHIKEDEEKTSWSPNTHEVVVLPLFLDAAEIDGHRDEVRVIPSLPSANATLVFAKDSVPKDGKLLELRHTLKYLTARLGACEVAAYGRSQRRDQVVVENIIRQCAELGADVLDRVNDAKRLLDKELGKHRNASGEYNDKSIRKIVSRSANASVAYLDIIDQIRTFSHTDEILPGKSIFFYSEPGCGKEMLAKLVHLFSPRAFNSSVEGLVSRGARRIDEFIDSFDDLDGNISLRAIRDTFALFEDSKRSADRSDPLPQISKIFSAESEDSKYVEDARRYVEKKRDQLERDHKDHVLAGEELSPWIHHRTANYFVLNCGLLDTNNFDEVIFGDARGRNAKKAGILLRAHLLAGTVFLDEFNTLHPPLANKLLRVLESPYQMLVPGESTAVRANVQLIFASNRTPDELERDGFNSAVISRITKTYIRVPPLRERKEDIALFVHKKLAKEPSWQGVRRINLDALRLICEQPWLKNYRGLDSFISALRRERDRTKSRNEEIGFREVLRCLRYQSSLGSNSTINVP